MPEKIPLSVSSDANTIDLRPGAVKIQREYRDGRIASEIVQVGPGTDYPTSKDLNRLSSRAIEPGSGIRRMTVEDLS